MTKINESGQMLILVVIATAVVLFTVLFIIGGSQVYFLNSQYSYQAEQASAIAEAGIDNALASLNKTGGTYNGESEKNFGQGSYSVVVTNIDNVNKKLLVTGYVPNKENPRAKRTIMIQASKGKGYSFNYGVQVGEGGLVMENSSQVNGSVYSNGNIVMSNTAKITGDAYVAGGTAPGADQSAVCEGANCIDFIFGKTSTQALDVAMSFMPSATNYLNKISLNLKKVGSPPNIIVRILADNGGVPNKNNILASGMLLASTVSSNYSFIDVTFDASPQLIQGNTYWIMIDTSANNSNYWKWSADLAQSYTRGVAKWSSNWQAGFPVWNSTSPVVDLDFKTYMGGVATSITGANNAIIGGDAYANTLSSLNISGDAYYQSQESITVHGSSCTSNSHCHPGSEDPPPLVMPISEANINEWKAQAEAANISEGDMIICGGGVLQSGKYIGNISSYNNCVIVVHPPVWITGNLSLANNVTYKLDSSMGASSGVIIVGDGGENHGRITLSNNAVIRGSGTAGSYLMGLSLYDSRINGFSAIDVANSGNSGMLYAPYGLVDIANSNQLFEINAWKVLLRNTVQVNYDSGLSSVFFSSGPQGEFSLVKGTYQTK